MRLPLIFSFLLSFLLSFAQASDAQTKVYRVGPVQSTATAGTSFSIKYGFEAVPIPGPNLQVFTHVLNASGQTIIKDAHSPIVSTTVWKGFIGYTRSIAVPATAVGTYTIHVGLYNPATGVRQRLLMGSGVESAGNSAYIVGSLVVSKPVLNSPYVPAGFTKIFSDEFNGTQLDTAKWWTRYVYNGGTLNRFNDEIQRYTEKNNHVVSNGTMKLVARPPVAPATTWQSGMVRSKTLVKYGYFESRFKVPGGRGVWPAFWLNPEDELWPAEIDILEFVNDGEYELPNMLHTSAIDRGPQDKAILSKDAHYNTTYGYYRAPFNFPDAFHTIGALWDIDDTVTIWIDGKFIVKYAYKWVHQDGKDAGWAHILLNLAMGGSWAGRMGVDASKPQVFEIDYVRVYQRANHIRKATSIKGVNLCPVGGGC